MTDTTYPTLVSVSLNSTAPVVGFAGVGKTISLSYVAKEPLSSTSATLAGRTVVLFAYSNTNYQGNITVAPSDPEGGATFTIYFTDLAGNPASTSTVTDTSHVTIGTHYKQLVFCIQISC